LIAIWSIGTEYGMDVIMDWAEPSIMGKHHGTVGAGWPAGNRVIAERERQGANIGSKAVCPDGRHIQSYRSPIVRACRRRPYGAVIDTVEGENPDW